MYEGCPESTRAVRKIWGVSKK